jgi:hypothetical protein
MTLATKLRRSLVIKLGCKIKPVPFARCWASPLPGKDKSEIATAAEWQAMGWFEFVSVLDHEGVVSDSDGVVWVVDSSDVSSTVGLTKEVKSNVSGCDVCWGGANVCCVVVDGTLTVLKSDMATTCLTRDSSVCIRSSSARFSEMSLSISEEGVVCWKMGSCLTTDSSGSIKRGATDDMLTPALTIEGGIPRSPASERTFCSGVAWRRLDIEEDGDEVS